MMLFHPTLGEESKWHQLNPKWQNAYDLWNQAGISFKRTWNEYLQIKKNGDSVDETVQAFSKYLQAKEEFDKAGNELLNISRGPVVTDQLQNPHYKWDDIASSEQEEATAPINNIQQSPQTTSETINECLDLQEEIEQLNAQEDILLKRLSKNYPHFSAKIMLFDKIFIQAEKEKGCLLTEIESNSLMAKNSHLSAEIMIKMFEIMIQDLTFSVELTLMSLEDIRLRTEYHRFSCCSINRP